MGQEPSAIDTEMFFSGIKEADPSVAEIAHELVEWLMNQKLWKLKCTSSGSNISAFSPHGTELFYLAPHAGNFHDKPYIDLKYFSRREQLKSLLLEKLVGELPDYAIYENRLKKQLKASAPWINFEWLKEGSALNKLKECIEAFYTAEFISDENNLKVPKQFEQTGLEENATAESPTMEPALSATQNLIFYGPPGTGKTFITRKKAVELCDGSAPDSREAINKRYEELRAVNRIEFVTFHQSFSYEDFVEGIRPVLNDGGADQFSISYECRQGVFKRVCSAAELSTKSKNTETGIDISNRRLFKMSLGDSTLPSEDYLFSDCVENGYILLGYGQGLDFTGLNSIADITTKLKTVLSNIQPNDYNITSVNYFTSVIKPGDLILISDGNTKFRAIGEITGEYEWLDRKSRDTYCQSRSVKWLRIFEESQPIELIFEKRLSQMTLYLMDQKSIKRDALQGLLAPSTRNEPGNYVLIIDEINRANISKVFGELITLIEPDKRLGAKEQLLVSLPYSEKPFGVPANLSIIGTMNTADRSIALVDIALRRRFEFKEMMPEYDLIPADIEGTNVRELLRMINLRIEYFYDRDHVIGHAYLMKVTSLDDLRDTFKDRIIPLLQEYFYGDWKKICLVLGCPVNEDGIQSNAANAIIKAKMLGLGYAAEEYENKPSFMVNGDFLAAAGTTLLPFFQAVISGPTT